VSWRGRRTPQVQKLQRKGDIRGLIEAASYRDELIDRRGQVFDRGVPIRVAALDALTHQSVEREHWAELSTLFATRLRDDSPTVVRAAAEALAADGSAESAWAMVDMLAEAGPSLAPDARVAVLDALRAGACPGISERWSGKVVDLRDTDLSERDRQDLIALMEADGVANPRQQVFELLAPLIVGIGDEHGAARRAETILTWCMPANLNGLEKLFAQHNVTPAVIRLAGQTGDQSLMTPLIGLLEHPSAEVRAEAAEALGTLCDTAAVLPLMGATSDPDIAVRRAAVHALDSFGGAGVTAALAVFARAAALSIPAGEPEPGPAEPLERSPLGGRPWSRTLARLTERASATAWARQLRGDGTERMAALDRARGRYRALLGEPNPRRD